MTFGLPQNLAPRLITKSFNRAAHIAAFVLLSGAFIIVTAFQVWAPNLTLWPAAVAVLPMAGVLVVLDRRRTTRWALLYLAVGVPTVYFVTWLMISRLEVGNLTDLLAYPTVKGALVLVGGIGMGRRRVVAWCTAAYVLAEGSAALAFAVAGVAWKFDRETALTYSALVLLVVLSGLKGLRGRRVESRLRRAAHDEVAAAVVHRIQQRASAILHDTVLNHLSTLQHAPDGPISTEQRAQLERDLALVRGVTLGESLDSGDATSIGAEAAGEAQWNTHPVHEAIRAARADGLDVDITGDPEVALKLAPDVGQVVALAVSQSLVNVRKHAGVREAEVAIHSTGDGIMIMVIDGGRGFEVERVAADRLGLRGSIRGRVESIGGTVQIWTGLGKGTSIVINVPLENSAAADGATTLAEHAP